MEIDYINIRSFTLQNNNFLFSGDSWSWLFYVSNPLLTHTCIYVKINETKDFYFFIFIFQETVDFWHPNQTFNRP